MASLLSALALCIIFMIIIELSNTEAGIHGKRTRNKKRKTVAPPVRMKHTKSEKCVRQLFTKRTQHKTGIKHVSSNRAVLRPTWNKKHTKKGIWTKNRQSNKIIKPKSQRSSMFVNKIKNQKGKGFDKKSLSKGKNSQRFLSKGKKRFSNTGIKRSGRRRGVKAGRKGKKILGPKIMKFDSKKLMNEVLVPGKDGVPDANPSLSNKVQSSRHYIETKDHKIMSNSSFTYSPIHKVEHVKQKAPITSISETTLVSYQDMTETTQSSKKTDASDTKIMKFDTKKLMNESLVPEKVNETVKPELLLKTYSPIHKEKPEIQKTPFTSRPEGSNKIMKKIQIVPKQTTIEEALREAREEWLEKKRSKIRLKPTTRTQTTTTKAIKLSPEGFGNFYAEVHCAYYANKTCFQEAAPSICHEFDWAGNCINGTHFFKFIHEKTYKEVTIPPFNQIVTPEPGDFHLWGPYNSGAIARCVVHRKRDGLIKDTCITFSDLLNDIPRLSVKIIETYYGSYKGNGNKREDKRFALDVIENVLNGYGTCERIVEKLPLLRQYLKKYTEPCLQMGR